MTINRRNFLELSLLAGAMGLLPVRGFAQSHSFAGKTVEWTIPFGEGGGGDTWARFFAPWMTKQLPGNPNVVIRNVPGGGSITGANAFAQQMPDDGLSILGVSGSTQFPYLLGDKRVKYDYRDFVPILVTPTGGVIYVMSSLGIKDASEIGKLKGTELVYANTGPTALDLVLMLAFEMLSLNVRHVFGMNSRGETRLALERGESTIDFQTSASYLKNIVPMVEEGRAVPLFSLGALDDDGNVVRDPTFPDLPNFVEVYKMIHGTLPGDTEMFRAYLSFFTAGFAAQKMALIPKTTAPEIIEAYRAAMGVVVADPAMQADKKKMLGAYKQGTGATADRMFKIATTIDPKAKAWMINYLKTNYNVNL